MFIELSLGLSLCDYVTILVPKSFIGCPPRSQDEVNPVPEGGAHEKVDGKVDCGVQDLLQSGTMDLHFRPFIGYKGTLS